MSNGQTQKRLLTLCYKPCSIQETLFVELFSIRIKFNWNHHFVNLVLLCDSQCTYLYMFGKLKNRNNPDSVFCSLGWTCLATVNGYKTSVAHPISLRSANNNTCRVFLVFLSLHQIWRGVSDLKNVTFSSLEKKNQVLAILAW